MTEVTQEQLKELFEYKYGALFWKHDQVAQKIAGKIAGSESSSGYLVVGIDQKYYLLHRLIYCFHFGVLPEVVDHIDGCIWNNAIENLRSTDRTGNTWNAKIRKDNKTGIKGVYWHKGRWMAQIRANKKTYRKVCMNQVDAIEFIKQKRIELHKEFTNHG